MGAPGDAIAAFTDLRSRFAAIGLTLNPSKCKVLAPGGVDDATRESLMEVGLTSVVESAELLGLHHR